MAGNQLGKTLAGGYEVAFHLTGLYPDWWTGLRFKKPIKMWAASVSGDLTRDSVQRVLFGESLEEVGTGTIPGHTIVKWRRHAQVKEGILRAFIRHSSGGVSVVTFKNYEQGRKKWQAETLDFLWFDEEPPEDVYSEGLTRTNNGQLGQRAISTFTPLMGMTATVLRFVSEEEGVRGVNCHLTLMGLDDVDHYTPEQKAQILMSYPPHEREARANGTPILGSGRIFTTPVDEIAVDPFAIPKHWAQIIGIDLGGGGSLESHPAAAVKLAHDRDNDIIYIVRDWRRRNITLSDHASGIRSLGGDKLPVAYPHDALQMNRKSGNQWVDEYRLEGLEMLPMHAQFAEQPDGSSGGFSLEEGVVLMANRFANGKLKVFKGCDSFLEEYGMYHRKDGSIVKLKDDAISAARYALMMIRFASSEASQRSVAQPQTIGSMGYTTKDINRKNKLSNRGIV